MIWFSVIVVCVICIVLYWAVFYIRQDQLLFPGYKLPVPASIANSEWLTLPWGKVECVFLPGTGHGRLPTVIVAHGQMGLIDSWIERMSGLQALGFNCLLVEFPGYGRSDGNCSVHTLRQTFCHAFDWVQSRSDVDSGQIIGLGRSMGGGVVSLLAENRPLKCLWLMSTFTSLRPFIRKKAIPGGLLKDPLDNLKRISQFKYPVLVLHGESDDIIPLEHGLKLAEAAPDSKLMLESGDHDTCPDDWESFWQMAAEFYWESRKR